VATDAEELPADAGFRDEHDSFDESEALALRGAAREEGRERQKELVDEAGVEEGAGDGRSGLREDEGVASLAEERYRLGKVDAVLARKHGE
jgi:hypothetical protein